MFWDFLIYSCHTLAQVYMQRWAVWQASWICYTKQLSKNIFLHLAETCPNPLFPQSRGCFCRKKHCKWWAPHWFWLTSLSNLHRFTDALWSSCKMWQYTFLLAALLTFAIPASEGCCLCCAHANILIQLYITEIAASRQLQQQFSERQIIESQVPSSIPCRRTMSITSRPLCLSAQN